MVTFAEYLERHARDDLTALKCMSCRRRRTRTDFREMPWHGRAAACRSCEGTDRYLWLVDRRRWEMSQEREKVRALRRGLSLMRGQRDAAASDAEFCAAYKSPELARLRAFVDEVRELNGWAFTGEPDQHRERLGRVWSALYELWDSEHAGRPYRGLNERS
ncbi:hypothetical protein [Kitasatospora sp. NPDC101183]|uniref:hypothetical protein n=1 Tax=Kitasatospora sp. NPDC101183 TaxID=3364100 RepID=UPI003828368D